VSVANVMRAEVPFPLYYDTVSLVKRFLAFRRIVIPLPSPSSYHLSKSPEQLNQRRGITSLKHGYQRCQTPHNRSLSEAFLLSWPTDWIIQLGVRCYLRSCHQTYCLYYRCWYIMNSNASDTAIDFIVLQSINWPARDVLVWKSRTDTVSIITHAGLLFWTSSSHAENKRQ
jgi:hypothetical protein